MQIIKILLVILILAINCFAQQNNLNSDSSSIYTFDVYFINGYELGYNFLQNDNSEFRLLLGIISSQEKNNIEETNESVSEEVKTSDKNSQEGKYSNNRFTLSAQYLHKFYKSYYGESYFGIGPVINYIDYLHSNKNNTENFKDYFFYNNSIELGVKILIGLRSYLTKSLSIFAECQLNGYKTWSYEKNKSGISSSNFDQITRDKRNGWGYDLQSITIGIRLSI